MNTHHEHWNSAHQHLRHAAHAAADHVMPKGVRDHLRQAMRHAFLAGAAALDRSEGCCAEAQPAQPTQAAPTPAAT